MTASLSYGLIFWIVDIDLIMAWFWLQISWSVKGVARVLHKTLSVCVCLSVCLSVSLASGLNSSLPEGGQLQFQIKLSPADHLAICRTQQIGICLPTDTESDPPPDYHDDA